MYLILPYPVRSTVSGLPCPVQCSSLSCLIGTIFSNALPYSSLSSTIFFLTACIVCNPYVALPFFTFLLVFLSNLLFSFLILCFHLFLLLGGGYLSKQRSVYLKEEFPESFSSSHSFLFKYSIIEFCYPVF
jgi:hypothetical protein